MLLTLHPQVGRWVQLGGYCEEGDTGLAAAALREATEESGFADLEIDPRPLHLDVHPIICSLGPLGTSTYVSCCMPGQRYPGAQRRVR